MPTIPIHPDSELVKRNSFYDIETVGAREKNWLKIDEQKYLFKENLKSQNEDWAEVLACEISEILRIPHAEYKFAHSKNFKGDDVKGVLSKSIVSDKQNLILANELLLEIDSQYPAQTEQFYNTKDHCINAISEVTNTLQKPFCTPHPNKSGTEHFAGYLMLDALIANQDRHHQNWGAISYMSEKFLAPSFDHAASFAQNVSDEEKKCRMTTKDKGYSVERFSLKARSAIFKTANESRTLSTHAAFKLYCKENQIDPNYWVEHLDSLTKTSISDTIDSVGQNIMSDTCKEFTLKLLLINIDNIRT